MLINEKIERFLVKTGRSYTSKSLSKVLHLNHETARKYLRMSFYNGSIERVLTKNNGTKSYRYFV